MTRMIDVDDEVFRRELGKAICREWWRGWLWGVAAGLALTILLAVLHAVVTG